MRRATRRFAVSLLVVAMVTANAAFVAAQTPPLAEKPAASFQPDDVSAPPDTWIFSGVMPESHQGFSGTLVAHQAESEFELKFANGVTCDGGELKGEIGLVRLPEITCTDDRTLRALFVPQSNNTLKVFGHYGDEKFNAEAHLLGIEAPPEPKQTAQPKGPLGLPPPGTDAPPR